MKQMFILLIASLLCVCSGLAEENIPATLTRMDGRAWRVFLHACDANQLTYQLEKSPVSKTMLVSDVKSLKIKLPKLNMDELHAQLVATGYAEVIAVLEPAVLTTGSYMIIPNNAEEAFALLTKAYLRNGDVSKARATAGYLLAVQNPALKRIARAVAAQAALEETDMNAVKQFLAQMEDPVAKLYLTALIERSEHRSKEAMQTVVELIASYPNNLEWMPQTEYLCAELYLDLEMPESAAEVAHQVEVLYPGSEFRLEARALSAKIKQLTETSGEPE